MTDAMTDPSPRLTNSTGNAQQTSVVTAPVSPTRLVRRSVRIFSSFEYRKGESRGTNQMRSGGGMGSGGARGVSMAAFESASGTSGRTRPDADRTIATG